MSDAITVDDQAVLASATSARAISRPAIGGSLTLDILPQMSAQLHSESWPQDRPIAKALANNTGLC